MASATPSHPSTKETSNYAWLCCLLVDVGSCVLREIFDRICPPGNLHTVLNDPKNHAKLQTLRKKRVLSTSQWRKLYPAFKSSVCSRDFDTSLLVFLLRNIWGLTLPASGQIQWPFSGNRHHSSSWHHSHQDPQRQGLQPCFQWFSWWFNFHFLLEWHQRHLSTYWWGLLSGHY